MKYDLLESAQTQAMRVLGSRSLLRDSNFYFLWKYFDFCVLQGILQSQFCKALQPNEVKTAILGPHWIHRIQRYLIWVTSILTKAFIPQRILLWVRSYTLKSR